MIPVYAVTRFRNKMGDRNNLGDSFLWNNDYSPLFTDGPVSLRETLLSGTLEKVCMVVSFYCCATILFNN